MPFWSDVRVGGRRKKVNSGRRPDDPSAVKCPAWLQEQSVVVGRGTPHASGGISAASDMNPRFPRWRKKCYVEWAELRTDSFAVLAGPGSLRLAPVRNRQFMMPWRVTARPGAGDCGDLSGEFQQLE